MLKNNAAALLATQPPMEYTLMSQISKTFAEEIAGKTDEIIKAAFTEKGFPADEKFIKEHVSFVKYEGDEFDHIWYHFGEPDALRIISIERKQNTSLFNEDEQCKLKWEVRYY